MINASDYSNIDGIKQAIKRASAFLRPPKQLTPVEWAEQNIKLPIGNAISGSLRFANTPYLVEPLNMVAEPTCERITLMFGAQTGKTTAINCAIGYFIAHEPQSQMMMQPSQGDLHTWLETKFNPIVEANESLKERIAKPRSREGVNNQAIKSYYGGFLMFSWAGSPRTMRGRSAPKIYCDEVDGYEYNAEGHPVNLLWQRSATFGDQRKLLVTSTPTIKETSFVERSFLDGDQRRFYVPCTECGEYQTLKWSNVKWQQDERGRHLPETAKYVCEHCGTLLGDNEKMQMVANGEWRGSKPFSGHASYHLSELYSMFRKWRDIVQSFLEKKANNDIKSFVNVSLAETWEDDGEQADPNALMTYAENYDRDVAVDDILLVTAGADVQRDRIEIQVVGWANGGVPYIIAHDIFYGDPMYEKVWSDVDVYLKGSFCGHRIIQAYIDSGYLTEYVYKFTKARHGRKIFPCKGEAGVKEIVNRPKQSGAQRAMLVKVGVDGVKRSLLSMVRKPKELIHFSNTLDEEFYQQLTAEKMMIKKVKGFDRLEFVKTRERNEALDCFVYAYASMVALNVKWQSLTSMPPPVEEEKEESPLLPMQNRKKRVIRRKGFARRW